ncbi:patatin-like phospholipase family protein [Gynurincola endophyticus]|jgi:predicted acylesterase/phospholipase RssA|uniref:patatin-like phospholipase family protein n=1 Tax=Gynurincola endophyticus TaxID=2479004 RepID=UPI000F8D4E41|nr:patatin-like phospholipase family protein [Gynurincola endophyticus]
MNKIRLFIAHLFIAIWAYFPSIVVCALLYQVFWSIAQSRDLLYMQVHSKKDPWLFILASLFLFYMIWHSSEIIGINKVRRFEREKTPSLVSATTPKILLSHPFYPSKQYFGSVSIIIAYIAYSIIIASFFRIAHYSEGVYSSAKFIKEFSVFFILQYSFYVLLNRINKKNERHHPENILIRYLFISILAFTFGYYFFKIHIDQTPNHSTIPITGMLTVFIVQLIRKTLLIKYEDRSFNTNQFYYRVLNFFGIQNKFAASFFIFNVIGIAVFLIYAVCVADIQAVQTLGPLTFLLLAIAIIIGVINFIIFCSIKIGFNIYVFIFIIALLFGQSENHYVRTIAANQNELPAQKRLSEHIESFLQQFDENGDYEIPMYFVLANGGASRAGWWTGGVLAYLQETSQFDSEQSFYQHMFAISSASGGSVGAASFLYKAKSKTADEPLFHSVRKVFEADLLSPGLSYFLSFDLGRYLLPISFTSIDRNIKLEQAFDQSMQLKDKHLPIQYLFTNDAYNYAPIFAFNVTRMQDGSPALVTNLAYGYNRFNNREDILHIMSPDSTLTISSAAFLSARFPYISPAGRINAKNKTVHYYVDGGYFDNSGAGFIQELLGETKAIIDQNEKYKKYRNRIQFKILHIKNAPRGGVKLEKTLPMVNDFLSPLITVMGAYDMQTNTNDYRLINYISDRAFSYDTITLVDKVRFRYPMNWVMSDFVMKRMDSLIQVQSKAFMNKQKINRY